MEPNASETASAETSKSLFDLNLPEVGPGEGPEPLPEPSYELAREHALFLLRSRKSGNEPQSIVMAASPGGIGCSRQDAGNSGLEARAPLLHR